MPIDKRLLDFLMCPGCGGGVRETSKGIECGDCGRVYPVRDGIPVMLVEEASPPTTGETA